MATWRRTAAGLVAPLLLLAQGARAQEAADGAEMTTREAREVDHGLRHFLDVMEIVDTPVYSRNMLETKYEWTEKGAGASMGQIMFKPVFAWGVHREFAIRVEAPVETIYPGPASGQPAASGFASLTTTFFWSFFEHEGLRQSLGLELQWNTATNPAVGAPWIIEPVYGIGYHVGHWLGLTLEVNWQKSFGNLGTYLPVNTLQFKPTATFALPAWWYASVQDKISWSFENQNLGQLLKFTAGRFLTQGKTVTLAVEYETPLDPVAAQGVVMMVGILLSYFYSW
ncbi:MAG: hypothetical protein WCK73_06710 [Deltaproteobacteria bacterium]